MSDLKTERLRVLKMMEERKITAEECAELLAALDPPALSKSHKGMTKGRAVAGLGAALVFIGFLMPWVSINYIGDTPMLPAGHLAGSQMPHVMGWMILVFAVAAPMLPKWKPGIFLLILGLAMLVSIAVDWGLWGWEPGLIVVFMGYVIELVGLLNERLHVEGLMPSD